MILQNPGIPYVFQAAAAEGAALACAAACIAYAAETGTAVAVALIACGVVLLTIGEIGHGAATWVLSFGLAPDDDRQPAYLGCFGMGTASAAVFGPWLLTTLTLGVGSGGWWIFGALITTGVGIVQAAVPRQGAVAPAQPSSMRS